MERGGQEGLWEYTKKLEMMDEVTGKSRLTERDALEVGRAIKTGLGAIYVRKRKEAPVEESRAT